MNRDCCDCSRTSLTRSQYVRTARHGHTCWSDSSLTLGNERGLIRDKIFLKKIRLRHKLIMKLDLNTMFHPRGGNFSAATALQRSPDASATRKTVFAVSKRSDRSEFTASGKLSTRKTRLMSHTGMRRRGAG